MRDESLTLVSDIEKGDFVGLDPRPALKCLGEHGAKPVAELLQVPKPGLGYDRSGDTFVVSVGVHNGHFGGLRLIDEQDRPPIRHEYGVETGIGTFPFGRIVLELDDDREEVVGQGVTERFQDQDSFLEMNEKKSLKRLKIFESVG